MHRWFAALLLSVMYLLSPRRHSKYRHRRRWRRRYRTCKRRQTGGSAHRPRFDSVNWAAVMPVPRWPRPWSG